MALLSAKTCVHRLDLFARPLSHRVEIDSSDRAVPPPASTGRPGCSLNGGARRGGFFIRELSRSEGV
jgi:hypothetical protein